MAECCKHLVHVFGFIICVALAGMVYAIDTEGNDLSYDKEIQNSENLLKLMLNSHPELGSANDLQAVDAHLKGHYVPVHPLYGILQSKSPFYKYSGYEIPSFDMSLETKPINKTQFYNQFLSKSMPVILRNECK